MNKQPFKALALALIAFALPVVAQQATDAEVKDVLKAEPPKCRPHRKRR